MDPSPNNVTMYFTVTLEFVQWVVGGLLAVLVVIGGWIWKLSARLTGISAKQDEMSGHIDAAKVSAAEAKLEASKLSDKLESVREELPSRSFIEAQLNQLGQRLDRLWEARINKQTL